MSAMISSRSASAGVANDLVSACLGAVAAVTPPCLVLGCHPRSGVDVCVLAASHRRANCPSGCLAADCWHWDGLYCVGATRKLFKMPSPMDEVRAWIGRRPRNIKSQIEGGFLGVTGGSVRMSVWSAMGSDLDALKRMDAMVANIEQLRKQAAEARTEHSAATAKLRTDMESRTRAIEEGLSGTTLTLRESETGGLWMAAAALIMLFVGTVLAGFADLLCRLVA